MAHTMDTALCRAGAELNLYFAHLAAIAEDEHRTRWAASSNSLLDDLREVRHEALYGYGLQLRQVKQ